MRLPIRIILPALGLGGCTAAQAQLPGTYHETRPNAIMFASKELRLYPDGRLLYFQHTDMIGSGKHAAGTYELRPGRLTLHLTGPAPIPPARGVARSGPAAAGPDSLLIKVWVQQLDGAPQPLSLASVQLYDAAGTLIDAVPCDETGQVVLPLRRTPQPHHLGVSSISMVGWQMPWPAAGAAYDVYLPPNLGTALPAGTTLSYQVVRVGPGQLVLRQGADTLTLVREP